MAEPAGQVTVTYYGHCAFLWETSQGARVLVDPYRNLSLIHISEPTRPY